MSQSQKQLRIKVGALKRLHKEYLSYVHEVETQEAKVKALEENNGDYYELKKQVRRPSIIPSSL